MALDPRQKDTVKENFNGWLEIKERRKELNAENKQLVEMTANILDVKKTVVNKLFNYLEKKMEGEDEMAEISEVMDELEA